MKRGNGQMSATARRIVLLLSTLALLGGALGIGYYLWENWRIRSMNQVVEAMYRQAERDAYNPEVGTRELASLLEEYMPRGGVSGEAGRTDSAEAERPAGGETRDPSPEATEIPLGEGEGVVARTQLTMTPLFSDLSQRNPDIIGWITSGGNVDYPVLWRNNEYYMDHNFFGQKSVEGAIFLDEDNKVDLSDDLLLVYGHNMNTGEMFGDLDLFRSREYLNAHPIITIQSAWDEVPRKYVIFSIFDASMKENNATYMEVRKFDFVSRQDRMSFLQNLIVRSLLPIDIDMDVDDRLLALVTCSYDLTDGRLLIWARELRENETETMIKELFMGM